MTDPVFVTAQGKLRGDDAVAAILILEDGRYVMQLRDPLPHIFYPDHWGCFGGAVEKDETPEHALRRELREELEFEVGDAAEFTRFDFDFSRLGQKRVFRIFYEVPVSLQEYSRFILHEGAQFGAFSGPEILAQKQVTPYDAFAIWMHHSRKRFSP